VLKAIAFVFKGTETRYVLTGSFSHTICLAKSANVEGALFRGFLGVYIFSPTTAWPYLSASFGIIHNRFDGFLVHRIFFTSNFGGGCRGQFLFRAREIGTENHCGRCTTIPLVQIWSGFCTSGGFPLAVWKSLWNLPKIAHLACCYANHGLVFDETKKRQNHVYKALFQGPSGTFSDLGRENRRYSLQVLSNLSILDVFRRKIVKTQAIWLFF